MSRHPSRRSNGESNEDTCEVVFGCWPFRRRRTSVVVHTPHDDDDDARMDPSRITTTASTSTTTMPRLVNIRRESSPLLTACWQQDWNTVLRLLDQDKQYGKRQSQERLILHRSHNTGRTALHLATMPGAHCPPAVLTAIIRANPWAVLTEDYHQYGGTPLHFCCGSKFFRDHRLSFCSI